MTTRTEPRTRPIAAPLTIQLEPAPARREVAVVMDACCEIAPQLAAALGIVLIPRSARIDRQWLTLDPARTLHATCWERPPRRVAAGGFALGELAQAYRSLLDQGMSVLALHQPVRIDGALHTALAARSALLSGRRASPGEPPRIAVYELAHSGMAFTFLAEAAARAALEGLALHHLLALLDQLQVMTEASFLTGLYGPPAPARDPRRQPGVAPLGSEQLWRISRDTGRFVCHGRGWKLAGALFAPGGPLHGWEPTRVRSSHPGLAARLNAGRATLGLPPLEIEPAGPSLAALFPHGCVELVRLPDDTQIGQIIDVIRRIERPAPAPRRPRSIGERR